MKHTAPDTKKSSLQQLGHMDELPNFVARHQEMKPFVESMVAAYYGCKILFPRKYKHLLGLKLKASLEAIYLHILGDEACAHCLQNFLQRIEGSGDDALIAKWEKIRRFKDIPT